MAIRCNKASLFHSLLTGVAIVTFGFAAHGATGTGNWSVNKVPAQNYCTVSQSFAGQGTVTLGQTSRNEYSIAFDFANPVFSGTKAQSISIKTDKVSAQNFSITPQSDKLAVLNLGQNNQLWQSFHKGDALTITVNGKNYDFKPAGVTKAQQDLSSCIASLNQPVKPAQVAPQAVVAQQQTTSAPVTNQELAVREENTKLRQALQDSQAQLQTLKSSGASSAKQNELSEKLRALEIENAQLKATGNAIQSGAPADLARAQAEISVLTKQKTELERQLQQAPRTVVSTEQLNQLSRENAELKEKLNDAGKNVSQAASVAQERDGLKAQLAQLQQQLAQAQAQKTAPTANDMKLADMQKENADLKARLAAVNNKIDPAKTETTKIAQERDGLKAQLAQANLQLAELQKKSIEQANQNTKQPDSKELQKRLAELQTENANLKLQMADAKQPTVTVNPNTKAELETLRAQIASLQSQNAQLQTQIATAPVGGISTTPAAQNFDLAQANKRYEEAQREIRRLGSIIQAQEQKFQAEKRDIEGMLFDPAIAAPAQVAMKESYEKRISDLESQLKSKGIAPAPSAIDPQAVARMVEPASGTATTTQTVSPIARMPSGYGAAIPSAPIPPITEAELARDMMPLPPASYIQQDPIIQQMPVERVIERVVEKSDPKKDAELARITQELEALKNNQNKIAQENEQLKTAMQQKQTARSIADKVPDNGLELSPPVSTPPRAMVMANFATARDITNLLKQSGVTLTESVSDMGGESDTYKAFRWKSNGLHGSIEQKVTGSAADYQAAIASYIDRARSRCKGDFAAEPATISSPVPNAQGYEIACIGGKVDSSASVFFTYSDRIMSTIAHEGKTELMGNAIAARDAIAQNFAGSVTASR